MIKPHCSPPEAKPGKEAAVADFLETGLALARQTTTDLFALRLSPTTFGAFDAFHDEADRQTHLSARSRKP
jgi:hypothetical protein